MLFFFIFLSRASRINQITHQIHDEISSSLKPILLVNIMLYLLLQENLLANLRIFIFFKIDC